MQISFVYWFVLEDLYIISIILLRVRLMLKVINQFNFNDAQVKYAVLNKLLPLLLRIKGLY